jgi:hypothetical protein
MEIGRDELGTSDDSRSTVILNYGDPAYLSGGKAVRGASQAEVIFLHILTYLLFSDSVSIPSRYILEGDAMSQAISWAAPLLEEGILQPERRWDAASFEDLARMRRLSGVSFHRAAFMDRHTAKTRSFTYSNLEAAYKALIEDDLSSVGGFRRVVVGGRSGRYEQAISRACTEYSMSDSPAPEAMIASVVKYAPELRDKATKWAMARYYTTPLLFDSWNTREIPSSAVELLTRGRVLDSAMPPFQAADPAKWAFDRISASIAVNEIPTSHRTYCEALLEVRRSIPQARRIFSDISTKSHLKDAGDSLTANLAEELAKQQRTRLGSGQMFTLVSSLIGGAVGVGISMPLPPNNIPLQLGSGLTFAVGSGSASLKLQNYMRDRKIRRLHPWILAVDRFADLTST